MKLDKDTFRLIETEGVGTWSLWIGLAGLAASAAGYFLNQKQFFFSWLTSFAFWGTIAVGGLFFTQLHHLVGAKWSVVIRRISETVMSVLPVLALFALPLIAGIGVLYPWSHPEHVVHDPILMSKAPFLNVPFFIVRLVLYVGVWAVLSWLLYKTSLAQDGSNTDLRPRLRKISAPGMLLFAFTLTFAAFDWLMSLEPHWFSTIYGVYVFAGVVVAVVSFLTLMILVLKCRGVLADTITVEHYHDLGKLLFAFTVFWAYIAFSQFFLIWYANFPEETTFFHHRWTGTWKCVSTTLVLGRFVLPFLILMNREPKRNPRVLWVICPFLLAMHWLDLYWLVMPNLHHDGAHFSWIDAATFVGIGGIFLWIFWKRLVSAPVIPVGDPDLKTSMGFVNQ